MLQDKNIRRWFTDLQEEIITRLARLDPAASEKVDEWQRPEGGGGRSHVFAGGEVVEKGGINFSHVSGNSLPPSATANRPEIANHPFEAMGVSVVLHPHNPFVPCTHMNVRFFTSREAEGAKPVWWFGGGFDLTPVYPFLEDAVDWHKGARTACDPFGPDLYPRFKQACDAYFSLPHRSETRGVGGLFFDDFNELDLADSFAFTRSVGEAFLPAWERIVQRRKDLPFGEKEKAFQEYRRGRYVEFNLLYDRGTLFGLQSKGRTESILMSMPPRVRWIYDFQPEPGSPEARLQDFLRPRNWLGE